MQQNRYLCDDLGVRVPIYLLYMGPQLQPPIMGVVGPLIDHRVNFDSQFFTDANQVMTPIKLKFQALNKTRCNLGRKMQRVIRSGGIVPMIPNVSGRSHTNWLSGPETWSNMCRLDPHQLFHPLQRALSWRWFQSRGSGACDHRSQDKLKKKAGDATMPSICQNSVAASIVDSINGSVAFW